MSAHEHEYESAAPLPDRSAERNRAKLLLVLAVCAAPVLASYLTYYFVRPEARNNYGELVEPQRGMPALHLKTLDGSAFDAVALRGRWLMLMVGGGDCAKACEDRLYHLRQVRLTAGKDRDRVARVWLITDATPLSTLLMREYDGTEMLRADPREVAAWLAIDGNAHAVGEHLYMVDPLGNLMMRFPENADPNKTKKDLARLLRASRIG